MAWAVSACSATDASLPWNSKNRTGRSGRSVFDQRLIAAIWTSSANSIRATGTPDWMIAMQVSTASSTLGKAQTAAETASGMPERRSVTSTITPSVPSDPTKSRVRS